MCLSPAEGVPRLHVCKRNAGRGRLTWLADGVQNPDNKKEILCDDVLEKLTGEKKFPGFSLQKFLKAHINPQED